MASLISQNISHTIGVEKSKRNKSKDPPLVEGKDATKTSKRKKEQNKELEVQQMKRLENLLFGSIYNPVGFGKDDDEEEEETRDDSSALFFVDRFAHSTLSVYEKAGVFEQVGKERKPVWLDDEEEKTSVKISSVNRLRKLRKEEGEDIISGSTYVARLRAHHAKLNPGTEWAHIDSQVRSYSSDDEYSDEESKHTEDYGSKGVKLADNILMDLML